MTDSDRRDVEADAAAEARSDGGHADARLNSGEAANPTTETVAQSTGSDGYRAALRHMFTIAATEYRLAVRGRWALALTGLFTVFGAMLLTFSGSAVGPEGVDRIIASLTSLVVYLVPLAALTFGYDAIVGREEEGWLAVVFSLPVRRGEVVVGNYLGRLLVLAGSMVLGFGFSGFLLVREYGTARWSAFLTFLVATVAVGAVFLALAVLLSTIAREKTHALGAALLVWVWFVLVHDLIALGVLAAFTLPDVVLSALVVANPVSVFRVLVLSELGTAAGGGFTAALAGAGLSQALLIGALLVWCILPVASASWLVRRRRL
ncbi:ABC transporter permease [Natronoarchaeum sp. GCM10025321]|uniref:ABC transporter permease n=1 Tax=Natronoarchaeum sp. GCM10025321 TaxID=3252684 RepID=UPI003613DEBD